MRQNCQFNYYVFLLPAYFSNARYPLLIIIATHAFHNGFKHILKEDFYLYAFSFSRDISEIFLDYLCGNGGYKPQENVRYGNWNTPSNVILTRCTFDALPNSTGTFLWATISSFQRDHYYDYYFSPSSTTNNQYIRFKNMHFFHSMPSPNREIKINKH